MSFLIYLFQNGSTVNQGFIHVNTSQRKLKEFLNVTKIDGCTLIEDQPLRLCY